MFARYGNPDVLISDNGSQFASEEFASFARKWGFDHITSSPHYPQSNGKAENAVRTVKHLFTKCRESNCSEFLALLDWRNTPTEGLGTSPAQRFLGRRCKTLLPAHGALLKPHYPTEEDAQAINRQKQRQQHYYDMHARPMNPLTPGDIARMHLPGQKTWSPGVCAGLVGRRSYEVKVGDRTFVRNRCHLIQSEEPGIESMPEVEESPRPQESAEAPPAPNNVQQPAETPVETCTGTPPNHTSHSLETRRSGRFRQQSDRFGNFVYY